MSQQLRSARGILVAWALSGLLLVGGFVFWRGEEERPSWERPVETTVLTSPAETFQKNVKAERKGSFLDTPPVRPASPAETETPAAVPEQPTDERKAVEPTRPGFSTAEERQVRRFAALTDRWSRPQPVSVEQAAEFAEELRKVPASRRMECLRRALNLIPDANAALLAGVLTDRSQDAATQEAVFRDVVNRSDEVKQPIVEAIAKDKKHPCSSDAEWIFAVTGERPQ